MADAKIRLSVDGTSQVVGEFDRVENKISKLEEVANRAKSSLALLGVGLGINEIARLSDEYTKYTAQLKLATNGETEYANARQTVSKIARESQSELAATGVLYARITNGTRELGISQQKVGQITEAVTLALKASGATQEESASATLQLSQAFAAGALRGEEFNSVNEAAPRLMKALADGLGVPIGALKNMASEGKITTEVLANNLPKALEDLRKEAAQVQTIAGAYTNLKNNVLEYIGAQAQQNGTAAILSATINTLANNLNYVSAAAAGFTTIKISQKLAEMATGMVSNIAASNELAATKVRETAAVVAVAQANVQETTAKVAQLTATQAAIVVAREEAIAKLSAANATIAQSQAQIQAATSAGALSTALRLVQQGELSLASAMQVRSAATAELAVLGRQQVALSTQATAATAAQTAAQTGLATATAAGSAGVGLLSRAVGFLGGPIGAVTTLLGLGVTAWLAWGNSSKDASEKASSTLEESAATIIKSLDEQIKRHETIIELRKKGLSLDQVKNMNLKAVEAVDEFRKKLSDLDEKRAEYAKKNEGREALRLAQLMDAARIERDLNVGAVAAYYQTKIDAEKKYQTERAAIVKQMSDLTAKPLEEQTKRMEANAISYNEKLKKWQDEHGTNAQRIAAELAKVKIEFGAIPPEIEKSIRAKYKDKKATDDQGLSYENLMKTVKEKIAVAELDIATDKALTEGQKLAAKFASDLVNVKNTLTAKQRQEINQTLELLVVKEKFNAQVKRSEELTKQAVEDNLRFADSAQDAATKLYLQVLAQQEHNAKIGLTKESLVALEVAQLQEDAAKKESLATTMDMIDWSGTLGDAYRDQAKQLRELAALKKSGYAKELSVSPDTTKAKELLDIMTELDNVTQKAAQGMASSFGKVGSAIGGLTTALSGYGRAQAAIDAQLVASIKDAGGNRAKMDKANAAAAAQTVQAQISAYGNMASAAKGFFKENSNGYKLMEGAEKAFRAAEMAMALDAMIKKTFLKEGEVAASLALNATKMSGEAASTGVSVGLAGTEASAWSITAVVKALASLPFPANLAAGAATLAAVVAVGAKVIGSFGGGGSGGGQTAAQRQKEQGTGSVFGDDSAKSDSIAKSIEEMSKSSNRLLPVNQGMLASLKNIESSMSGMTNLLVRTPGITNGTNLGIKEGNVASNFGSGIFSIANSLTGGIFASVIDPLGKLIQKLWGGTKTNIVDSGVQFGGKLSELQAGRGFSQYASVDTTTSKWFGLQKNTSNSVQTQGLNAELSSQMGLIFSNMSDALKEANKALGGSTEEITKTFQNLTLSTEKISLKGLTGTALTDALNAVISKSLDEMAAAVIPSLDQFRAQGEGYAQTVMRVASNYLNLDSILSSVEMSFGTVGITSLAARERLIALAGGIDKLAQQTESYAQDFLSEEERLAPAMKAMQEQMAALGASNIKTKEEFKSLVKSLDLTTESGAKTYVTLMAVAPAFSQVTAAAQRMSENISTSASNVLSARVAVSNALRGVGDAVQALADRAVAAGAAVGTAKGNISSAYFAAQDALVAAQQRVADVSKSSAAAIQNLSGNLESFLQSLKTSDLGSATSASSYRALKEQLGSASAAAKGGDISAQNGLVSIATAFLKSAKDNSHSAIEFAGDESYVKSLLADISSQAKATLASRAPPAETADPETAAYQSLQTAQNNLAAITALATATGASMTRADSMLDSYAKLQADYSAAIAANIGAQRDYGLALELTKNLQISIAGPMSGLLGSLLSLDSANQGLASAQAAMEQALMASMKSTSLAGLSAAELAAKLGLTGTAATAFVDAFKTGGLSAALATSTDASRAFAERVGLSGTAIDTLIAALGGTGFEGALGLSSLAANNLTSALNALGLSAVDFNGLIRATGASVNALITLVNGASSSIGTVGHKSAEQTMVASWYASNPNAIKYNDPVGTEWWINDIKTNGVEHAKLAFANSVALTTGTKPIPVGQFAKGGLASGWSIVGEEGAELVNFSSPGRVYTARETQGMLGGADNSELIAEIRKLREEVEALRASAEKTERNTKTAADRMAFASPKGDRLQVEIVT